MRTALAPSDKADFERLETVVREGLQTFVDVGSALMEIRERGLYKEVCSTFESYVQIRFHMSRQHAYKQIAAAEVVVGMSHDATKPETLTSALALAPLPPEQRQEAWDEAVASAPEGRPRTEHVQKAVERRTGGTGKAPKYDKLGSMREQREAQAEAMDVENLSTVTAGRSEEEPEFASEEDWIRHEKREAFKAVANEPWAKLAAYLEKLPLPPKWSREEINAAVPIQLGLWDTAAD